MNVDERAAHVAARSRVSALVGSTVDRLELDAHRSYVVDALATVRARVSHVTPTERLRLTGVCLIACAVTNSLLVRWSPSIARPAAANAWDMVLAVAGLATMVLAYPLARAWATSRVRQLLFPASRLNRRTGEPT